MACMAARSAHKRPQRQGRWPGSAKVARSRSVALSRLNWGYMEGLEGGVNWAETMYGKSPSCFCQLLRPYDHMRHLWYHFPPCPPTTVNVGPSVRAYLGITLHPPGRSYGLDTSPEGEQVLLGQRQGRQQCDRGRSGSRPRIQQQ